MVSDLCAVLLAGGESRRMGFNKALLLIDGRPLIQRVLDRILPLTDEVLLSTNDPSVYDFLKLPSVPDRFKGQGPLAGLHAAMLRSPRSLFLLLACDMPNLHERLLRRLISSSADFDAVIPSTSNGRSHPLCAIYCRTCFPEIDANLRVGGNKVTDIFLSARLKVKWLKPEEGEFADRDLENLNTPDDLAEYRSKAAPSISCHDSQTRNAKSH